MTTEPTTLLAAASNDDTTVALVSLAHQIRVVLCREHEPPRLLNDPIGPGGPSARPALHLADGSARAAVIADHDSLGPPAAHAC